MLEQINEHILELKNSISLRFVEPMMREQTSNFLQTIRETCNEAGICVQYIRKIEEVHERMMEKVGLFLDQLTPFIDQYNNHLENAQIQMIENANFHRSEVFQQQTLLLDANEKIQKMSRQISLKDQQNRQLILKIQQKDITIDNVLREEDQMLKKMQMDFQRQQNALEQSYFIITKLQQKLQHLQKVNMHLQQTKNNQKQSNQYDNDPVVINNSNSASFSAKSKYDGQQQNELVQCSLISSHSDDGLSQFQEIKGFSHSREGDSKECQQILNEGKGENLREMLNLSVEKQYLMRYNKCDSIEFNKTKQNCRVNWLRDSKSKSKQKQQIWAVNQSLQLMDQTVESRNKIKQFKLPNTNRVTPKVDNPYYIYFVIACQNVKIRSQKFEQICQIQVKDLWQNLNNEGVALHRWEEQIQKFLMAQWQAIRSK